mmetsp:Transcript_18470/g.36135  ORF Transcript_18470/g.36135 Transcript_18470/m.36135 type:complete len:916 (+) Transcript_18470:64-2811(+)
MANFQPQREWVDAIVNLYKMTLTPNISNEQNQAVFLELNKLQQHPEFDNYVAFILSTCVEQHWQVRWQAGLALKNRIKSGYRNMSQEVQDYIKVQTMRTIGVEEAQLRHVCGSILTTIASNDLGTQPTRLEGWGELLQHLSKLLGSQNFNEVEGALNTVAKICEDVPQQLDQDELGRPLTYLIPQLISMFANKAENIRKQALGAVNQFLNTMYRPPQALITNMDNYMQALFAITDDSRAEIRKRVCQALILVLEVSPGYLVTNMENVIKFMLVACNDEDESVALAGCEFWGTYCEVARKQNSGVDLALLKKHLKHLLPLLLKGMVYSDQDLAGVDDGDDAHVPDTASSVKPRFHNSKHATYGDDSDDEWAGDDDGDAEWNLRKSSAHSLDVLATVFSTDLLGILFPLLNQKFVDQDWRVREAAILALGAIADGCYEGIEPHLKELVPFLVHLLDDAKPLVRKISCWTLSRFARWVVAFSPDDSLFLGPVMVALLNRVLDKNKKVQEAACSAFATLEEEARERLIPHLKDVLSFLMRAFYMYQTKNLLILYDALGTLAEAVKGGLNNPELVEVLVPPLWNRWEEMNSDDRNLIPLLDCVTAVAGAIGMGFAPFVERVFVKCLQLIEKILVSQRQYLEAKKIQDIDTLEPPDKEFVVTALDLLSGVTESMQDSIASLVKPNVLLLLLECIKDDDPEVRQSGFALLGDFAKHAMPCLQPHLGDFLPVTAENLNPWNQREISVCNNASWAIGEISVRMREQLAPFVQGILQKLIPIVKESNNNFRPTNALRENAAITLGRITLACPQVVAPFLEDFFAPWCRVLLVIGSPAEKLQAFESLFAVIAVNPQGVLSHFHMLLQCIAHESFPRPDQPPINETLKQKFHALLHQYKKQLGAQWGQYASQCPPNVMEFLANVYQV